MSRGDIEMKNSEAQGMQAGHDLTKLLRELPTSYLNPCITIRHRHFDVDYVVRVVTIGGCHEKPRTKGRERERGGKEIRESDRTKFHYFWNFYWMRWIIWLGMKNNGLVRVVLVGIILSPQFLLPFFFSFFLWNTLYYNWRVWCCGDGEETLETEKIKTLFSLSFSLIIFFFFSSLRTSFRASFSYDIVHFEHKLSWFRAYPF